MPRFAMIPGARNKGSISISSLRFEETGTWSNSELPFFSTALAVKQWAGKPV